jgi:hypothetical protein
LVRNIGGDNIGELFMKKKSKTILEEKGKAIVFTFGRFQPPTAGHQLLMDKVKSVAKKANAEHRIFTSSTNDKKKNPLTHKEKVSYMKKFFRDMNISTDSSIRTPFEALQSLSDGGYKHVIMVVGGDRVDEFRKQVVKYIGDDGYQFDSFKVVSAGKRDPDAEDVTGMSASKMRKAASDGDFATFINGLPSTSNITLSKKLYNSLRKRMKITEKVDNINKKKKLPVEDGTDESRENRQMLTPGQPVEKYTNNEDNMMDYSKFKTLLDERTSPLPKATGFALTYPMKDNKQVTKLTKLGGKVDRVNKRVVFKFNTVAARTKFRKKNKELLSTITESVQLDERVKLTSLKSAVKYVEQAYRSEVNPNWKTNWKFKRNSAESQDWSIEKVGKLFNWEYHGKGLSNILSFMSADGSREEGWEFAYAVDEIVAWLADANRWRESVELDEANTGPMSDRELARWKKAYKGKKKQNRHGNLIYKFPKNSLASQFVHDIENSGIAIGNVIAGSRVEVQMLPGSKSVSKSGLEKYSKKNKGKLVTESITEQMSPAQAKKMGIDMPLAGKGYPYNESRPKTVGENMKTYKDFKNTLSEQGEYTPSGMKHTGRDARDSNVPLHDLGNPEALGAVNAFIEQYTTQEYMNPRQAVSQLRARLNTVGLHFDFQPNGTVEEGKEEYPLTLFGGRSGWDMEKGGMSEDDGITPKLGYGLSMQIEYTVAESGLYRIGAKIVKQAETKGQ